MAWWTVNGVHFTGTVVTVGPSGRDYTGIKAAVDANTSATDLLVCIYAGTYSLSYYQPPISCNLSGKNRYFKAMEPGVTIIGDSVAYLYNAGNVIVEACALSIANLPNPNNASLYLVNSSYDVVYTFSRCNMSHNIPPAYSREFIRATSAFTLMLRYCTVNNPRGYFMYTNFTHHNRNNDEIIKCQLGSLIQDGATHDGQEGSFKTLDYKIIPTTGYGYGYGTDLIQYHAPVLMTVTPPNARIPLVTGTQQYTATGVNDVGEEEDLTSVVTWASSETGIATIDSAGLATLVAEGDTVISATTPEGLVAYTTLHVTNVVAGNKWSSSWRPPIAVCYLNGQVITVGASSSGDETPSQSRVIRWSEIGQFDFLGQSATSKRNEAGVAYAVDDNNEILLNVRPLGNMAIVYGSLGCYIMKPVSKPVVSFGITRMADMPVGIPCTLAVAGNRQKHLLLGRDGNLRMLSAKAGMFGGETYEIKYLGFSEFFKAMVDKCEALSGNHLISVVYNEAEDEFYISDGMTSFKYDEAGLTEMGITVSSIINIKNAPLIDSALVSALGSAPIGFSASLQNKDDLLYMSDTFTFDVPGIKTIESLVVDGSFSFDALVEVMVMWRNSKKDTFAETDWLALSPEGFCAPLVSGMEFRLCIRAALSEDTEINKVHVTWKTSDRRFIRGNDVDRAET